MGDRFTEGEYEWAVVAHPAAFQGGKSLSVRIRRPGVTERETEMIWPGHIRVQDSAGEMSPRELPFLLPWVKVNLLIRSISGRIWPEDLWRVAKPAARPGR